MDESVVDFVKEEYKRIYRALTLIDVKKHLLAVRDGDIDEFVCWLNEEIEKLTRR